MYNAMFEEEFPFSNAAISKLHSENKVALSEVSDDELFEVASYIESVMRGSKFMPSMGSIRLFAISRIIVALTGSDMLANKFAESNAKQVVEKLHRIPNSLNWLCTDLFKTFKDDGNNYSLELVELIAIDPASLCARNVENGRVYFGKDELIDLVWRIAKKRGTLARIDDAIIPEKFKLHARDLIKVVEKLLPAQRFGGFKAQFLELNCMKRTVQNGAEEGKRYYGCLAISIACLKDSLTQQQAETVIKQYVEHCKTAGSEFTLKEGLTTLAWVYKRQLKGFSCNNMRSHKFAREHIECKTCPLYLKEKRK